MESCYNIVNYKIRLVIMRYRLQRFFWGRNGFDALANTVMVASLIVMLASYFIPVPVLGFVLYLASLGGLIYSYFRCFSRNLFKRRQENFRFKEFFRIRKLKWKERKSYRYFKCPHCKAWMRVPKGRGSITVTCRVCRFRFDKKS